ncbi:uncharacterized protein TNCT_163881 [Trichonephila clavata]|uniref:Uncharacterized protein n=1 Tax=Trichonephila clavata TaxID=2740835 RepID=A0A8X6J309_TRICU|nr:uncharacterized protein TNCT_163881 [Trichonephila clavata]
MNQEEPADEPSLDYNDIEGGIEEDNISQELSLSWDDSSVGSPLPSFPDAENIYHPRDKFYKMEFFSPIKEVDEYESLELSLSYDDSSLFDESTPRAGVSQPQAQPILPQPQAQPFLPEPQVLPILPQPQARPIFPQPQHFHFQLQPNLPQPLFSRALPMALPPVSAPRVLSPASSLPRSRSSSPMASPSAPMSFSPVFALRAGASQPQAQPILPEPQVHSILPQPQARPIFPQPQHFQFQLQPNLPQPLFSRALPMALPSVSAPRVLSPASSLPRSRSSSPMASPSAPMSFSPVFALRAGASQPQAQPILPEPQVHSILPQPQARPIFPQPQHFQFQLQPNLPQPIFSRALPMALPSLPTSPDREALHMNVRNTQGEPSTSPFEYELRSIRAPRRSRSISPTPYSPFRYFHIAAPLFEYEERSPSPFDYELRPIGAPRRSYSCYPTPFDPLGYRLIRAPLFPYSPHASRELQSSPSRAPQPSPSGVPQSSPSRAQQLSAPRAPQLSLSRAPQLSLSRAPQLSLSRAPQLSPSVAPQASPSVAPQASPSVAPQASPSVAPQASPSPSISSSLAASISVPGSFRSHTPILSPIRSTDSSLGILDRQIAQSPLVSPPLEEEIAQLSEPQNPKEWFEKHASTVTDYRMMERELKQLMRVYIPDSDPEGLSARAVFLLLVERINQLEDQYGRITICRPPVSEGAAQASAQIHEQKAQDIINDYIRIYYIHKLESAKTGQTADDMRNLYYQLLPEKHRMQREIEEHRRLDEEERRVGTLYMMVDHEETCPFIPLVLEELKRQTYLKAAIPGQTAKLAEAQERCQLDVAGVAQWIHLFPATFETVLKNFLDSCSFRPGEPISEEDERDLEERLTQSLQVDARHKQSEYLHLRGVMQRLDEEKRKKEAEFQEVKAELDACEAEVSSLSMLFS